MRKILLVEDEDVLRETYEIILSTQPYKLDTAENGQVALDLCKKHVYDLILLDLMMPVLDGVGFLRQYRYHASAKTRIILLTNLSSGTELDTALKLGAHRNVVKAELSPKELLSVIRYELNAS